MTNLAPNSPSPSPSASPSLEEIDLNALASHIAIFAAYGGAVYSRLRDSRDDVRGDGTPFRRNLDPAPTTLALRVADAFDLNDAARERLRASVEALTGRG